MTSDSHHDTKGLAVLGTAAFALGAVLMAPAILQNGDLYWHIATGRWIIENHAVLRIDPFSYTFTGYPWHSQGWLAQLLLAGAYLGAGFGGVLALCAVAAAAAAGSLAYFLSRFWRGLLLAGGILLSLGSAASAVSALPYLLVLPFGVIYSGGLVTARAENRRPPLVLLLALLLWANLHASFILGFGLTLALGLEAVVAAPRLAVVREWLVYCGFALIVCWVTPYGFDGLVYGLRAVMAAWQGPVRDLTPLLIALPAFAVLVRLRATLIRAAFVAGLFGLALHWPAAQLLLAAAAPLLLAEPLARARFSPAIAVRPALAFAVLALVALALRAAFALPLSDSPVTPAEALSHVPEDIRRSPVLNEAAFGGYLIVNDVRPFIDSRPHYPARFRAASTALGDPARLVAVLARYHIRWTLLSPSNPAVRGLDRLGWKRLYTGPFAIVHLKDESPK